MYGFPANVENPETYVSKADVSASLREGFVSFVGKPEHALIAGELLGLPVPIAHVTEVEFDEGDVVFVLVPGRTPAESTFVRMDVAGE